MRTQLDLVDALLTPMQLSPLQPQPLISVIVANYNYRAYLGQAVDSILAQTYRHFEVVICDDGSTDGSLELAHHWAAKDSRVRVLSQENAGQAAAWNHAFAVSRGDVLCFLDSDDSFYPEKLEVVVAALKRCPVAGVAVHQLIPVSEAGRPIPPPRPWALGNGWLAPTALKSGGWGPWPTSSAISIRREVADLVFPIPEDFKLGHADTFMCGASQFLTEFVAIPSVLGQYRLHGQNVSGRVKPTAESVRYDAVYNEKTVHHIKYFLSQNFDPRVACAVSREDSIYWYWEQLLGLFTLEHRPPEVFGFSRDELLAHVSRFPLRLFWHLVTRCPPPIDMRLLEFYWSLKPLWRRLRFALANHGT